MSVAYNRRRGAKANRARKPKQCVFEEEAAGPSPDEQRCGRFADGASSYCSDHRYRFPSIEGPIAKQLRREAQARQQREDALLPTSCKGKRSKVQDGIKPPAHAKARLRKLKRGILLAGFLKLFGWFGKPPVEKKKSSPWSR